MTTLPLLELIVADEAFELENVLLPLLSVVKALVMESPYIAVIEELAKFVKGAGLLIIVPLLVLVL